LKILPKSVIKAKIRRYPQEEVAQLMKRYDLIAVPVVDREEERLVRDYHQSMTW
jgi:Mg/Co/Ni transporter MgtE